MTETVSEIVALSSFSHRHDYDDVASRDRWTVRALNAWGRDTLPPLVAAGAGSGAVLDVGCGEQPFRPLVESNSRRYVGVDAEQNSAGSVDILSTLRPTSRSWYAKGNVALLRLAAAAMVRLLDSNAWSSRIAINSNSYSSNGGVLRAA